MASLEVWRPIPGYEGIYEVSDFGRIRSYKNNKWGLRENPTILEGLAGKHYKYVILCKGNKKKTHSVHRLVAEAFIDKPEGKNVVNHIDGNKHNNFAVNLEWCSHADNMHHANISGLCDCNRKEIVCFDTGEHFKSITDAATTYGIGRRSINNCVSGKTKTAGNLRWGYAN